MPRLSFIIAIALLVCLGLAGCASNPSSEPSSSRDNNPVRWIGRWVGVNDQHYLQIMPVNRADHYRLTIRNGYRRPRHYDAWRVADGLDFMQDAQAATVRTGRGDEGTTPELAILDDCLIVHAGDTPAEAYCRRPATADGLPLQRGSYVQVRAHCWDASPADMLYYDGQGIARADQHACRASIMRQQGVIYTLANNCHAQTDNTATTEQTAVTVVDDEHFALAPFDGDTTLYEYCPGQTIPASIQR